MSKSIDGDCVRPGIAAGFQDNGTPSATDAARRCRPGARDSRLIMPVLEQALVDIERDLRNIEPLFSLTVEDVKARSQSYMSFVVPGLLAFTLMTSASRGSGFNIVEYRRKGILKRLFVTPIRPKHFIGGLVLSRTIICMTQLTLLVADRGRTAGRRGRRLVRIALCRWHSLVPRCSSASAFVLAASPRLSKRSWPSATSSPFRRCSYRASSTRSKRCPISSSRSRAAAAEFRCSGLREIIVNGLSLAEQIPTVLGLAIWLAIGLSLAIRLFRWKEVAA